MITIEFQTAKELGHFPVPLEWDTKTNAPKSHLQGWEQMQDYTIAGHHNAMAVRTCASFTFIDIDTKNSSKNTATDLRNYIMLLLSEQLDKKIFDKLFIEQSRNGGLHIFISYPAPKEKVSIATSSTGAELVALYPENRLCYTYPTPGCVVLHGQRDEMEPLEENELQIITDLLNTLDEPKEVEIKEASIHADTRPDKWKFFDTKIPDEYFAGLLNAIGLEPCKKQPVFRKDAIVYEAWRRKESSSPLISAKVFFGKEPKVLLYTSSMPQYPSFQTHSRKGDWTLTASKILYYKNNQQEDVTDAEIESIAQQYDISLDYVVTNAGNIIQSQKFWESADGKITLKEDALLTVISNCGFRRYKEQYVQVIDNIVEICDTGSIIRTLTGIVQSVEATAYNAVSRRLKGILTSSTVLDDLAEWDDLTLLRDDPGRVWRFFSNTAICISKEGVEKVPYREIHGSIWKSDIMQREYNGGEFEQGVAWEFVKLLGGDGYRSLMAMLGYNLTRYNDPADARITMFLEDISEDDEGTSVGGSGKSILGQFPKYAAGNQVFINGKDQNRMFSDFAWSRVNPDTRTVFIDDVHKGFKIEMLFSIVTGEIVINKKHIPEFTISFRDRPKIIITSNYAIGEDDDSTQRRLWTFAVEKFFDLSRTPLSHFGHRLFDDWDEAEWSNFDNFMNGCVVSYLKGEGVKRAGASNIKRRMLINSTDRAFVEYMDALYDDKFFPWFPMKYKTKRVQMDDGSLVTNAVDVDAWYHNRHKSEDAAKVLKSELLDAINGMVKNKISQTQLTQWVNKWAATKDGLVINSKYRVYGNNGMYYKIDEINTEEWLGEDLPF